jgi:hypothetical protein
MTSLDLPNTQKRLWKLITAPETPSTTLSKSAKKRLPIVPGKSLTPEQRLDIYANMYFFRILEALGDDFPGVLKVIGEARFHNLITDYLVKHPSRHFSLRYVGRHLPRFLAKHTLLKKWPFLADLAAFEYALLDVYDQLDLLPLSLDQLKTLPPEEWADLPLSLLPAHAMLQLDHRVDITREKPKKEKVMLLVWRFNHKIFHRPLSQLEFKLLKMLSKTSTLEALGNATARHAGTEQGSIQLAGFFNRWLKDGVLRNVR